MSFSLKSKIFRDGNHLTNQHSLGCEFSFGCDGQNISPELNWENISDGTQSLAITFYIPDAPKGRGFWHRLIVNIPIHTSMYLSRYFITLAPAVKQQLVSLKTKQTFDNQTILYPI